MCASAEAVENIGKLSFHSLSAPFRIPLKVVVLPLVLLFPPMPPPTSTLPPSLVLTKHASIISALTSSPTVPLWSLRELALNPGGLLSPEIRRRAWPKLMGVDINREEEEGVNCTWVNCYERGREGEDVGVKKSTVEQVGRDVDRSLWHFGEVGGGGNTVRREKAVKRRQKVVGGVIIEVLRQDSSLHYYQGYHDIASVFLSSLSSPSLSSALLLKASRSHLADAMAEDFTSLINALRLLIFPLVSFFDPPLHSHLKASKVEPFFALSWLITWFSHDVRSLSTAARLFDAFISGHPLLPVYVSIALVTHSRSRDLLLATSCDFPSLHAALCSLPSLCRNIPATAKAGGNKGGVEAGPGEIDWQELIERGVEMMREVPPRNLRRLAEKYRGGGGLRKVREVGEGGERNRERRREGGGVASLGWGSEFPLPAVLVPSSGEREAREGEGRRTGAESRGGGAERARLRAAVLRSRFFFWRPRSFSLSLYLTIDRTRELELSERSLSLSLELPLSLSLELPLSLFLSLSL